MANTTNTLVHDSAVLFAQSEVQGAKAVEMLASYLGTDPAFDTWENCRIAWQKDYATERKANDEASAKAWQRMAKRLEESYALAKPKAPSKAATTRAASRAKATTTKVETLKALVGTDKPTLAQVTPILQKLNNEVGKAIAAGDQAKLEELRKQQIAVDAAQKAAYKAERADADKIVKDAEKSDRQALIDWAKAADITQVRAVLKKLPKAEKKAA